MIIQIGIVSSSTLPFHHPTNQIPRATSSEHQVDTGNLRARQQQTSLYRIIQQRQDQLTFRTSPTVQPDRYTHVGTKLSPGHSTRCAENASLWLWKLQKSQSGQKNIKPILTFCQSLAGNCYFSGNNSIKLSWRFLDTGYNTYSLQAKALKFTDGWQSRDAIHEALNCL